MNRPVCYCAGPMSGSGDIRVNVSNAIAIMLDLIHRGYAPIAPQLSYFADPSGRLVSWDLWIETDLAILARCDVVLRIPGVSPGADREIDYAENAGIPVVYSVEELETWRASV